MKYNVYYTTIDINNFQEVDRLMLSVEAQNELEAREMTETQVAKRPYVKYVKATKTINI